MIDFLEKIVTWPQDNEGKALLWIAFLVSLWAHPGLVIPVLFVVALFWGVHKAVSLGTGSRENYPFI